MTFRDFTVCSILIEQELESCSKFDFSDDSDAKRWVSDCEHALNEIKAHLKNLEYEEG